MSVHRPDTLTTGIFVFSFLFGRQAVFRAGQTPEKTDLHCTQRKKVDIKQNTSLSRGCSPSRAQTQKHVPSVI